MSMFLEIITFINVFCGTLAQKHCATQACVKLTVYS